MNELAGRLAGMGDAVALAVMQARAVAADAECRPVPGGLALDLWGGEVRLLTGRRGLRLHLTAPDARLLFILQEAVGVAFEDAGAAPLWDKVEEGALAPSLALMAVVDCRQITPGFRRLRLTGPDVARFAVGGLHLRLLIPPVGRNPDWPRVDAKGRTRWPEGDAALHRPVYTTRAIDPVAGWMDIDILLHAGGRTTEWAALAQPGAEVGLMGPGGGWLPEAAHIAFFGDATAAPAIARMLEMLPAPARGHAVLNMAEADWPLFAGLRAPAGVTLHRVTGDAALLAALQATPLPEAGRFIWAAGEVRFAEAARAVVRERGLAKGESAVAAYWTA